MVMSLKALAHVPGRSFNKNTRSRLHWLLNVCLVPSVLRCGYIAETLKWCLGAVWPSKPLVRVRLGDVGSPQGTWLSCVREWAKPGLNREGILEAQGGPSISWDFIATTVSLYWWAELGFRYLSSPAPSEWQVHKRVLRNGTGCLSFSWELRDLHVDGVRDT